MIGFGFVGVVIDVAGRSEVDDGFANNSTYGRDVFTVELLSEHRPDHDSGEDHETSNREPHSDNVARNCGRKLQDL
jgi:hypothetical protein